MNNINAAELRNFVMALTAEESGRLDTGGWWQTPLLATAPIDTRFDVLPQIAAEDHLHPRDLLATAESLIVFYIPFKKELVQENRIGDRPCRNWGAAYVQTNHLIERIGQALQRLLFEKGFQCGLTPATHNFDENKLMARWSHKHLAYLANLGRFGTHHMLITPAGCTGRLGSLVTEAGLGDNPIIDADEACLLKAGEKCGKCIAVCPVKALGANSFDRRACWNRLNDNRDNLDYFSDLPESTHVCGKCAATMPCSFKNPVSK